MKQIRLSNFKHITGVPYRLLEDYDFIEYEEHLIAENARRLREESVDVALVSAAEFALCGDYRGLDFGIGCKDGSHRLILYAKQPIHTLHTIHVYEDSGAAIMLLKILLCDKWHISPRIVRGHMPGGPEQLGDNEGVVILHDEPIQLHRKQFVVQEDLAAVWRSFTGHPFVFLLWASKQQSIDINQHRALQEAFFRCHQARTMAPENLLNELPRTPEHIDHYKPDTAFDYYLDDELLDGLNYFYDCAARRGLLPASRYKPATYSIMKPDAIKKKKKASSVDSVLQDTVNGQRVSIANALRLALEAKLSDLGLAADLMRRRMFTRRAVRYALCFHEDQLIDTDARVLSASEALPDCASVIILPSAGDRTLSFEDYRQALSAFREQEFTEIEALGIPGIQRLVDEEDLSFSEVLDQLVQAGLSRIPAWGGGLLIDNHGREHDSASMWIRGMQEAHFKGVSSSCALLVSPHDHWQDRLTHLHRLRTLQDHTSGFKAFSILLSREWSAIPDTESQLRAIIIARLFLDNIPSFQELDLSRTGIRGLLNLCFGSNAVRILINNENKEAVSDSLAMLQLLTERGMEFQQDSLDVMSAHFLGC